MKKKGRILSLILSAALVLGTIAYVPADKVQAADPTVAHPNATVIQAENATLSGGARTDTGHTGYTGTAFVGGFDNSATATVTFNVNVPDAGDYYLSFRYSAGAVGGWPNNRTLGLTVNGVKENVTFKGTDSTWNTWEELIIKKSLNKGSNTVSLSCLTNNDNSDSINLDKLSYWKYSANPTTDAFYFTEDVYNVSTGGKYTVVIKEVDSNGVLGKETTDFTLKSADENVVKTDGNKLVGVKAGTTTVTATRGSITGKATVKVADCPTITASADDVLRDVPDCMFGYILTPNWDVPDSRITLLGTVLNRETMPVQNFQAIGDMDGSLYQYEGSVLERHLESYRRGKDCGVEWYMLLGHNPSWATASGNPTDGSKNEHLKTPQQDADFKQYTKDMFQYLKDNGAKPDYADLTNEYWTGTENTFKGVWEALREVYPDQIPAVGPGAVGYSGIPDFYIPFCDKNDITLEGPSWHEYWTSDTYAPYSTLKKWADNIRNYQNQYKKANGEYVIWEENNAGSTHPTDWTRSMSNVVRTGVDKNIKGCLESNNWNGMSDILTTNINQENPAARRPIWWVYYMFGQMSGKYLNVETTSDEAFTGTIAIDENEKVIKAIVAKNNLAGPANVVVNDLPFEIKDPVVDIYKINRNDESNGLALFDSVEPLAYENGSITASIDCEANDSVYVIIKSAETAKPGFFCQVGPEDGDAVGETQTYSWTPSTDAESYILTVSKNKDLSDPVIVEEGIKDTSFESNTSLEKDEKYYWSVTAVNSNGKTVVSHDVKYSFVVCDSADVPGQFGPYLPSVGAKNEAVNVELKWSNSYKADSFRVVVSENADLSDPVIDQSGITSVRGTGQFGNNSQYYYRINPSLKYKTKYYWMVYAVNGNGERPMNGVPHYFTTKAEGDAPEDFALVYPADNAEDVDARAVLEWEPAANAFFYELKVWEDGKEDAPVIKHDRMIYNRYTVEQGALEPGKTYHWSVKATTKDKKYESDAGEGTFTVKNTPCSPLLYSEVPGDKEITLYIKESIDADSYIIEYTKANSNYKKVIKDVTGDNYTVTGLKPGEDYTFCVKAVNQYGESDVWNYRVESAEGDVSTWKESDEEGETVIIKTATPAPNTNVTVTPAPTDKKDDTVKVKAPKKVTLKKVVSAKKKTVKITWKKASCKGYQIVVATNKKCTKGKKTFLVKKAKTVSKIIKKLASKKKYYVKIRAYNLNGKKKVFGKFSNVKSVTVK